IFQEINEVEQQNDTHVRTVYISGDDCKEPTRSARCSNVKKAEALPPTVVSVATPSMGAFDPAVKDFDSYEDHLRSYFTHYRPETSMIVKRFHFYKRDQRESEDLNEYVLQIKKLAMTCEFGEFLDNALRDKLICRMRYLSIQKVLSVQTKL
ncbi:hypothetical protein B566_EDAN004484, partial [Ephemera danica]